MKSAAGRGLPKFELPSPPPKNYFNDAQIKAIFGPRTAAKIALNFVKNPNDIDKCLLSINAKDIAREVSRGHLTSNADFDTRPERAATFYYTNVAPQWQITNGGNYAKLEDEVRKIVSGIGRPLDVYTGTHGRDKVMCSLIFSFAKT